MSLQREFLDRLDELWERRTAKLRNAVVPHGRGKLPKFTHDVRESLVNDLLDTASAILTRDAKALLDDIVVGRKLLHIRGWGNRQRGERLSDWVYYELSGPIVYMFWKGDRCLYVGKGRNPSRLYNYERHIYIREADCVEVLFVRSKSYLAQAECLATHLHDPSDKRAQPARVRWGKKCPICKEHDFVRSEIKGLFKMR